MTPPADNIRALIDKRAAETPRAVFFVSPETGKTVDFRGLRRGARAAQAVCRRLGVGADETAGFMLGNGWGATQLSLGIAYGGRIAMPLNRAASDDALAYALRNGECRAVFVDRENAPRLRRVIRQAAATNITLAEIDGDEGIGDGDDAEETEDAEDVAVAAESRALLMHTSGTTGVPKGVVHDHRSLLAGGANTAVAHQLRPDDRALCVLPLCHINGLCVTVFAPLVSGGGVVMPHRFRAADFWRQIAAHDCSWFSIAPTIVAYLLRQDETPKPTARLRFGRCASAPLSPEQHRRFEDRFQTPLLETMGLTETAAQILANPAPPQKRKYGSPGIAIGNEVAILDGAGRQLPPHQTGEIAVRGDNVMREYHRDAAETAAAFAPGGWLLTGDLGHYDDDGYFFVTGRRKELIIKGGENIAPREVDEALLAVAEVAEAAAFACPCEIYGQRVEAGVVLVSPQATTEAALIAHCHGAIGKFKSPDRIHFLSELPKGASGKAQRLKLADMLAPSRNSERRE